MDDYTLNNWRKVKATLEESGKTDSHFYRRALAILAGKPDPLEQHFLINRHQGSSDNP